MLSQRECDKLAAAIEEFCLSGSPVTASPETVSRECALRQRAASSFDTERRLAKAAACTAAGPGWLMEEDDDGDVEYKWRLTGITPTRLEHLITQMSFRVGEGNGQCLYELGVANNGSPRGLPSAEFQESISTIHAMAKALDLDVTVLEEFCVQEEPIPLWCGEILVTRRQATPRDGRIAFCGTPGCGKSTLLGVVLTRSLDDGAGSARQSLFNHKHEMTSGKTTSIVTRGIIVDADVSFGTTPVNRATTVEGGKKLPARSLTIIDLGGEVTKHMLLGLLSRRPDFTGVCVSVERPPGDVLRYARVCCALRLPFFVVVTKIDGVADFELDGFLMDLAAQLSTAGCDSVTLESAADVERFRSSCRKSKQVPLLRLSSTDGTGLELFHRFLASLPVDAIPPTPDRTFEVLLDGSFVVRDVGPVVHGHVALGTVELGQRCSIGPDLTGAFYPVVIKGIHVDGSHVTRAQQADEATFALSELPEAIDMTQKGKRLIPRSVSVAWDLEARVRVLSQTLTSQLQPILYAGNVRQAVRVESPLPRGEAVFQTEGVVRLRFLYHPEVLREGASIVLQWAPEGIAVGQLITVFA